MFPPHQNARFSTPHNEFNGRFPHDTSNSTAQRPNFFSGSQTLPPVAPNAQPGVVSFNRLPFPGPPPDFSMMRGPPPRFDMGPPPFLPANHSQFIPENQGVRIQPPFPTSHGNQSQMQAFSSGGNQVPVQSNYPSDQMKGSSKGQPSFTPQMANQAPPSMYSNFPNTPPPNHSSDFQHGSFVPHSNFTSMNDRMLQEMPPETFHFNVGQEQPSYNFDTMDDSEELKPSFDKYQREKDQYWIDNWLKKNGKLKSFLVQSKKQSTESPSGTTTKLHEVQQAFHHSIIFLAKLQQQCRSLENITATADTQTWEAEKNLTEEYRDKCIDLHKFLNNGEMLHEVKQKIETRRKKRARLKRRRREANEEKEAERERRETIHQQLDDWKNQMAQLAEDEKQKAELKKSADSTLSSVRKKISDAKKTQEFLKAFQKLRKIRRVAAINQGRYASDAYDVNFEKKMDELSKLMTSQQNVYETEEKTLKVMLEAVEEETRERDKEIKQQKERARERREKRLNAEKLFGKNTVICEDDELYPFYTYYTQAEHSLEALVQIRHDWDMHLVLPNVSAGSRVPDGFILPVEPSSDVWASALK